MSLLRSNKAEPTLALKPRGGIIRDPKQGCQWPQKGQLSAKNIKIDRRPFFKEEWEVTEIFETGHSMETLQTSNYNYSILRLVSTNKKSRTYSASEIFQICQNLSAAQSHPCPEALIG